MDRDLVHRDERSITLFVINHSLLRELTRSYSQGLPLLRSIEDRQQLR